MYIYCIYILTFESLRLVLVKSFLVLIGEDSRDRCASLEFRAVVLKVGCGDHLNRNLNPEM